MSSTTLSAPKTILAATLASAWLCGGLSSISLLAIPAISESSSNSIIVAQFTKLRYISRLIQPPGNVLTSFLFFYAAYSNFVSKVQGRWKFLSGAGCCLLSLLGFTAAVLEPTSHALMDLMHYHDIERSDGQDERDLLSKWGRLNGVRAGMAGIATALGVWVLVG